MYGSAMETSPEKILVHNIPTIRYKPPYRVKHRIPFSKFTSGCEVFDVADFCTVYFNLLVDLCGEYRLVPEYQTVLNHLIFG